MRQQIIALLALAGFMLLPTQLKAQDKDPGDKTWPYLGGAERLIDERRPRFIIESEKLKVVWNTNPLGITRCDPSSQGCFVRLGDFFSEPKGRIEESVLRPGIIMHHYPQVLFERHHSSTGTYVFYLPKQKLFYLWGDCGMGHADLVQGPFAGDPRSVLKKLAEPPDALALIGFLVVPFRGDASVEAWPNVRLSGIDISKLKEAEGVGNPLSLERCRGSVEKCVMTMEDFSSKRGDKPGWEKRVLRPDVVAHYYAGFSQQYVFYLPKQNIFYVAGYGPPGSVGHIVSGPFAGDPRLELKKFAEDADAK
jgi:hypothetical protein